MTRVKFIIHCSQALLVWCFKLKMGLWSCPIHLYMNVVGSFIIYHIMSVNACLHIFVHLHFYSFVICTQFYVFVTKVWSKQNVAKTLLRRSVNSVACQQGSQLMSMSQMFLSALFIFTSCALHCRTKQQNNFSVFLIKMEWHITAKDALNKPAISISSFRKHNALSSAKEKPAISISSFGKHYALSSAKEMGQIPVT